METKLKQILNICEKINKEEDFNAIVTKTSMSVTILLTDDDSSYEECIHIGDTTSHILKDKVPILQDPETVHIISEGIDYTKLTFDKFYNNFIDNWSEFK